MRRIRARSASDSGRGWDYTVERDNFSIGHCRVTGNRWSWVTIFLRAAFRLDERPVSTIMLQCG